MGCNDSNSTHRRRVAAWGLAALATFTLTVGSAVRSAAQSGPTIRVTLNDATEYVFPPGSPLVQLSVPAGQTLTLEWEATATAGRTVDAFRYGWDIVNPQNDELWEQTWCATCFAAPARSFSTGVHMFFLDARDSAGDITEARIQFTVSTLPVEPTSWSSVKARFDR